MKFCVTTVVLLMDWQTEDSQTGWGGTLPFTAWGLSPTKEWYKKMGMTVRRQWNPFSLSSDGVVVEDVNTPAENFPEEITPTHLPKPEICS